MARILSLIAAIVTLDYFGDRYYGNGTRTTVDDTNKFYFNLLKQIKKEAYIGGSFALHLFLKNNPKNWWWDNGPSWEPDDVDIFVSAIYLEDFRKIAKEIEDYLFKDPTVYVKSIKFRNNLTFEGNPEKSNTAINDGEQDSGDNEEFNKNVIGVVTFYTYDLLQKKNNKKVQIVGIRPIIEHPTDHSIRFWSFYGTLLHIVDLPTKVFINQNDEYSLDDKDGRMILSGRIPASEMCRARMNKYRRRGFIPVDDNGIEIV